MLTLPINTSTKYYINNRSIHLSPFCQPNLIWNGICELAIVNIQYQLNLPNFNVEFGNFIDSVKEIEAEEEKQKELKVTGHNAVAYFKA